MTSIRPHRRAAPLAFLVAFLACWFGSSARAQEPEGEIAPPAPKLPEWVNDPAMYMVAIEALVVEISDDKTRDLGIHAGYVRNDLTEVIEGSDVILGRSLDDVRIPTFTGDPDTGITSTGFRNHLPGLGATLVGMDIDGGVLSARLRALLDMGEAEITSRPIVLAIHGTAATINVGQRVPYQDFLDNGNPTVAEGTVGVKMVVTPTITDLTRGKVELSITTIEVSTLSDILSVQNIDRPVFSTSTTRSTVPMNAGETYKLSSFKGKRKREYREGIPFLMRIPILGRLFSSVEQVMEDIDVIFFLTPHIIAPGENIILPYDFKHGEELTDIHGVKLITDTPTKVEP